jgi:Arc/MetJ family transcription regulator
MLLCMRTTIDITDELLRQAKKRAAEDRVPLRQVVESALRVYLGRQKGSGTYRLKWRAEHGQLQPGVDLDDRNSLFDAMEKKK